MLNSFENVCKTESWLCDHDLLTLVTHLFKLFLKRVFSKNKFKSKTLNPNAHCFGLIHHISPKHLCNKNMINDQKNMMKLMVQRIQINLNLNFVGAFHRTPSVHCPTQDGIQMNFIQTLPHFLLLSTTSILAHTSTHSLLCYTAKLW